MSIIQSLSVAILLISEVHSWCPEGFRAFEEKACFYYQGYNVDTVSRDEAKTACIRKFNSTLASIDNPDQELWLVNQYMTQDVRLNPNNHVTAWIGLIRAASEVDRWVWEDGSPSQHRNWGPNEPNNFRDVEDCGLLIVSYRNNTRRYSWNDAVCESTRGVAYNKASGYFCRLSYKYENPAVSPDGDPKCSNIVRSNVALSITVVILLIIVFAFVAHALLSNRAKIIAKWPLITFNRSISMEELKVEQ